MNEKNIPEFKKKMKDKFKSEDIDVENIVYETAISEIINLPSGELIDKESFSNIDSNSLRKKLYDKGIYLGRYYTESEICSDGYYTESHVLYFITRKLTFAEDDLENCDKISFISNNFVRYDLPLEQTKIEICKSNCDINDWNRLLKIICVESELLKGYDYYGFDPVNLKTEWKQISLSFNDGRNCIVRWNKTDEHNWIEQAKPIEIIINNFITQSS